MIKLLRRINRVKGFKPADFEETTVNLHNPCRGWFEIKTFRVEDEPDFAKADGSNSGESLVLLLLDIGAFRDKDLTEAEITRMEGIIAHYCEMGKDIILRVAYDTSGKGMEAEPLSFKQVISHAEQVAGLLKRNREKIFLYQGLLVGRWGEMHTTKYASADRLRELDSIFEEMLGDSVYRAVRKPVQWRTLRVQPDVSKGVKANGLGVFNDGMFGSDSDLGTFDSTNKDASVWTKPWNRENETAFLNQISQTVPLGGEALFGEGFASSHSADDYIRELRSQGITYLNRYHDIKLIEHWQKESYNGRGVWNGHTCFEYIGAHLGYRFLIKEAEFLKEKESSVLELTVENCGFAGLYRDVELVVSIDGANGASEKVFEDKLNVCRAGETFVFRTAIQAVPGKYYVSARQLLDCRKLYFANKPSDSQGRVFIGEI